MILFWPALFLGLGYFICYSRTIVFASFFLIILVKDDKNLLIFNVFRNVFLLPLIFAQAFSTASNDNNCLIKSFLSWDQIGFDPKEARPVPAFG